MSSKKPTREVARRVFAQEFNDAGYTFKESDDDRAPVYVLCRPASAPTACSWSAPSPRPRMSARTASTGGTSRRPRRRAFVTYAGQYQPDAASMLRELEPPAYVASSASHAPTRPTRAK